MVVPNSPARCALIFGLLASAGCPRQSGDTHGPDAEPQTSVTTVDALPYTRTPIAKLSTATLRHTELVRITRNFGKSNFEIALDAWTTMSEPHELADVRLWWAKSDRDGERNPFSDKSRGHFEIEQERLGPTKWRVDLGTDKHTYRFWIELGPGGTPAAYADVIVDGRRIAHCRVVRGTLEARKLFGAPVGIRDFKVECVDADGTTHQAAMTDVGE